MFELVENLLKRDDIENTGGGVLKTFGFLLQKRGYTDVGIFANIFHSFLSIELFVAFR